jgi:ATP-GRASP peptide maturase of grasp-with-spasm system
MVLILSMESDISTIEVIDWLDFMGIKWKRLNGEDIDETNQDLLLSMATNSPSSNSLFPGCSSQIRATWYRRFHGFHKIMRQMYPSTDTHFSNARLERLLIAEVGKIHSYCYSFLTDCFWLDRPMNTRLNKLHVLELARNLGFQIPKTIVTNKKEILQKEFCGRQIVTKHISEADGFYVESKLYLNYTSIVDDAFISSMPEIFFPSLFQEKIEKKYEIRAFFLFGKVYAMAIFSQSSEQTKVDFRQYDFSNLNRMVPFALPMLICEKITKLMSLLDLNHGSIDMIKSTQEEYVFLEVNPIGQFGMVSYPCNYFLEEEIAKSLSKNGK